ncbi:hypothetical protein B0H15DRAFT_934862 [Mycena belliarum]|uniref:Uncharacterized protein n=1 Tax=Mycena belliarum TaxID=1033014 RepID=A0AAD6TRH9_9AGAR|nr:hypothetical protein B0H15DRAFT_934862 [Mycena belliae]
MGRRATLSPSQLAEIDKYLAAYKAKRAEGLANKEVTLWKKETIDKIWASEPFCAASEGKIAKKFDNYIRTAPSDGPKVESIASGAVDMFSGDGAFTGMSLFEDEEKTSITQTAMDEAKRLQVPFIGRYKPALANAWNALDDEQRATYQARALAMVNDVEANQKVLARALWSKMAGVPEARYRPEVCMLTRQGETASLESEMPEYATQIVAPWTEFVKKSLRRSDGAIAASTHIISGLDVQIERNQDGLPLFPALKFSDMTGASILRVGMLLAIVALALPWDEIESDPARYYDASFVLPIALKAVDSLQDYEVLRLARYLVDCTPPFRFPSARCHDGQQRRRWEGEGEVCGTHVVVAIIHDLIVFQKNKAKARCAAGEGAEDLGDDGDEDEGAERSKQKGTKPKARHGAGEGADAHEKDEGGKTKVNTAHSAAVRLLIKSVEEGSKAQGATRRARPMSLATRTRKKSARCRPTQRARTMSLATRTEEERPMQAHAAARTMSSRRGRGRTAPDAGPRGGRGRCHSRRGREEEQRPMQAHAAGEADVARDEDEEEERPMQAHAAGEDDVTRDEDDEEQRPKKTRKRKAGDGGKNLHDAHDEDDEEQRPKKTRKRKAGDGGKDLHDAHDEDRNQKKPSAKKVKAKAAPKGSGKSTSETETPPAKKRRAADQQPAPRRSGRDKSAKEPRAPVTRLGADGKPLKPSFEVCNGQSGRPTAAGFVFLQDATSDFLSLGTQLRPHWWQVRHRAVRRVVSLDESSRRINGPSD